LLYFFWLKVLSVENFLDENICSEGGRTVGFLLSVTTVLSIQREYGGQELIYCLKGIENVQVIQEIEKEGGFLT
jgi:hypothetical protein